MFFSFFSIQILLLVALGLGSGLCFLISLIRFCCWQPWVQDPDYVFLFLCLGSVVGSPGSRIRIVSFFFLCQDSVVGNPGSRIQIMFFSSVSVQILLLVALGLTAGGRTRYVLYGFDSILFAFCILKDTSVHYSIFCFARVIYSNIMLIG